MSRSLGTTDADEIQVRNRLDHQRVYDPTCYAVLSEILSELKAIKQQLVFITEEEVTNDAY